MFANGMFLGKKTHEDEITTKAIDMIVYVG